MESQSLFLHFCFAQEAHKKHWLFLFSKSFCWNCLYLHFQVTNIKLDFPCCFLFYICFGSNSDGDSKVEFQHTFRFAQKSAFKQVLSDFFRYLAKDTQLMSYPLITIHKKSFRFTCENYIWLKFFNIVQTKAITRQRNTYARTNQL